MFGPLTVTYTDGRVETYDDRKSDGIRFERHFRMPVTRVMREKFDDNGNVEFYKDPETGIPSFPKYEWQQEHLWYFAYCGAMRAGEERTFDEWMDDVEAVSIDALAPKAGSKKTASRSRSRRSASTQESTPES